LKSLVNWGFFICENEYPLPSIVFQVSIVLTEPIQIINIVRINEMAVQTAEGVNQTPEASNDLTRLSTDLRTLVQRFQVLKIK
jgi:hypothetical protein